MPTPKPEYIEYSNGYRFGEYLICPNWYEDDGNWFICLAGANEWEPINVVNNEQEARTWVESNYRWMPADERLYKIMVEEMKYNGIDNMYLMEDDMPSHYEEMMKRIINRFVGR